MSWQTPDQRVYAPVSAPSLIEGGWLIIESADDLHVVPNGDLVQHALDDVCLCGPATQLYQTETGDRWSYTHHSLDGREQLEDD